MLQVSFDPRAYLKKGTVATDGVRPSRGVPCWSADWVYGYDLPGTVTTGRPVWLEQPVHAIASAVATVGLWLGDGWEARYRQSVLRLKAVASSTNSALTLDRPRSKNRRPAICSLRMPKTGSFNPLRRWYKRCACSVSIHKRCLRINVSAGPIHSARPVCLSLVQTPKAGQARHTALGARYRRKGPRILPFAFLNPNPPKEWVGSAF